MHIKKIAIIGPESTGKSTLCNMLARHFNTIWVPEYAREYLEKNGTNYTPTDLLRIAQGQLQSQQAAMQSVQEQGKNLLFTDTEMYVMKVWSEYVFNRCDLPILNALAAQHYDMYLLCKPDLPWVEDELREYPDPAIRQKLYHYYKDALVHQHRPWVEIYGNYEERFDRALAGIKSIQE